MPEEAEKQDSGEQPSIPVSRTHRRRTDVLVAPTETIDKRFTSFQLFGIVGGSLALLLSVGCTIFGVVINSMLTTAKSDRDKDWQQRAIESKQAEDRATTDRNHFFQELTRLSQREDDQMSKAWNAVGLQSTAVKEHANASRDLEKKISELIISSKEQQIIMTNTGTKLTETSDILTKTAKAMNELAEVLKKSNEKK